MFMRVVTGHTSNCRWRGGRNSDRTEDRGQRSPQLPPGRGEGIRASQSGQPLELTPPVLDGSSQIKPNQTRSRSIKAKRWRWDGLGRALGRGGRCMKPNGYRVWDGGTASRPMWGAPLAERPNRSGRHDSRDVFFDTPLDYQASRLRAFPAQIRALQSFPTN